MAQLANRTSGMSATHHKPSLLCAVRTASTQPWRMPQDSPASFTFITAIVMTGWCSAGSGVWNLCCGYGYGPLSRARWEGAKAQSHHHKWAPCSININAIPGWVQSYRVARRCSAAVQLDESLSEMIHSQLCYKYILPLPCSHVGLFHSQLIPPHHLLSNSH